MLDRFLGVRSKKQVARQSLRYRATLLAGQIITVWCSRHWRPCPAMLCPWCVVEPLARRCVTMDRRVTWANPARRPWAGLWLFSVCWFQPCCGRIWTGRVNCTLKFKISINLLPLVFYRLSWVYHCVRLGFLLAHAWWRSLIWLFDSLQIYWISPLCLLQHIQWNVHTVTRKTEIKEY